MIGNHWSAPGLLPGSGGGNDRGDLQWRTCALRCAGIVAIMLLAWGLRRGIASNAALADVGAVVLGAGDPGARAGVLCVAPDAAACGDPRPVRRVRHWLWCLPCPLLLPAMRHGIWSPGTRRHRQLSPAGFRPVGLVAARPGGGRQPGGRCARHPRQCPWLRLALRAGLRRLDVRRLDNVARRPAGQPGARPAGPSRCRGGSRHARCRRCSARRPRACCWMPRVARLAPTCGPRGPETVAAIVGEASQDLRFNQRLLEAALENMSQGISVVDRDLRLVAWNRRYQELFGYPAGLLRVGMPIAEASVLGLCAESRRSPTPAATPPAASAPRAHARRQFAPVRARVPRWQHHRDPRQPDAGGGFVATFTDVTAFRQAEAQLKRSNETLSRRVVERTACWNPPSAKPNMPTMPRAASRRSGTTCCNRLHAAHLFADALASNAARASSANWRGRSAAPSMTPPTC